MIKVKVKKQRLPKQRRGKEKYKLILKTSAELFAKVGYHKTSTQHIATKAKIPVASIYQFFDDKKDILEKIIDDCSNKFEKRYNLINFKVSKTTEVQELSDFMKDLYIEFYERYPILYLSLCFYDQEVVSAVEKLEEKVISVLGQIIKSVKSNFDPEQNFYLLSQWKSIIMLIHQLKRTSCKNEQQKIEHTIQKQVYGFYANII